MNRRIRNRTYGGVGGRGLGAPSYLILRDDGTRYAEKLRGAGVPVSLRCHERFIHGVFSMDGIIESVRPAVVEMAGVLRKAFGESK
jgi:acetyl esterase